MSTPRESLALTIATAIEVQESDRVRVAEVTAFDLHIADAVIAAGWMKTKPVSECIVPGYGWIPCPKPDTCGNPTRTIFISGGNA
jgi:hypothetical protein